MTDTSAGWDDLLVLVRRCEAEGPLPEPERRTALDVATSVGLANIPGLVGCSISRQDAGVFGTPAAAGAIAMDLDRLQYAQDDGPCLRAAREGRPFRLDAMADEELWPDFRRRAIDGGVTSSLSLPLTRSRTAAALNLYGGSAGMFSAGRTWDLADLLARATSALMADAESVGGPVVEGLSALRMRRAIADRTLVVRAQGVLMAREGLTAGAAYHRLAVRSAETTSSLRDVAEEVLSVEAAATAPESEAGSASSSGEDVSA